MGACWHVYSGVILCQSQAIPHPSLFSPTSCSSAMSVEDAIVNGNEQLLSEGLAMAQPETRLRELTSAVQANSLRMCKMLVNYQTSMESKGIDSRDSKGRTPLMHSVGGRDLFDVLEQFERDVGRENRSEKYDLSAVLSFIGCFNAEAVARKYDPDICPFLIEAGANVDLVDSLGRTAVHYACIFRTRLSLIALIRAGANLNMQDSQGYTPLQWASFQGHPDIVRSLIQAGAGLNIPDAECRTALMFASDMGHSDIVTTLIEVGASLNVQNREDRTALLLAASRGRARMVAELIRAGADVNLTCQGGTALHLASSNGHAGMAAELIRAGADVDILDEDGCTALMCACTHGHADIVKLLIQAGADMNQQDMEGDTVMMVALRCGHSRIADLILSSRPASSGAIRLNAVNRDGETVLSYARAYGHHGLAHKLLQAGAVAGLDQDDTE